jgi:hypothetical protein
MNQERKMRMQKEESERDKMLKDKNHSILFIILAHIYLCAHESRILFDWQLLKYFFNSWQSSVIGYEVGIAV